MNKMCTINFILFSDLFLSLQFSVIPFFIVFIIIIFIVLISYTTYQKYKFVL